MALVPKPIADRIAFFESKLPPFTANAVAIGSSVLAVGDLTTKTEAARDALTAQVAAQETARAATNTLRLAVDAMGIAGASIIDQVRAKAKIVGDSVYSLAEIPAPATPTPSAPPGKPERLVVTLDETGVLQLGWKCPNPVGVGGTMYQVYRRNTPVSAYIYLGGVGAKEFIDETLPAGSSEVTYKIQAVRSTAAGPWATFNVNFGVGGGGVMVTAMAETTPPKLAV